MGNRSWAFFLGILLVSDSGVAEAATSAAPLETTEHVEELGGNDAPVIANVHGRANDVVSITVDYLRQMTESLDTAAGDDGEKLKILEPFCLKALPNGNAESIQTCEKRFRWYAGSVLARAKLAIATNNEASAELKDSHKTQGVGQEILPQKNGSAAPGSKPPTVLPFVPRYGSIQADRAARDVGAGSADLEKYLASPEFEAEIKRTLQPKPSRDDFVNMIKRGDDTLVPKRKADGSLDYDDRAFKDAMDEYNASMGSSQQELGLISNIENQVVQEKRDVLRQEVHRFADPAASQPKDPASRDAMLKRRYDQAHDSAVQAINDRLADKGNRAAGRTSTQAQVGATGKPGEAKVVQGSESAKESKFLSVPYGVDGFDALRTKVIEPVKVPKNGGAVKSPPPKKKSGG